MRYASDSFKDIQNELVRPPLKIFFEVGTDVTHVIRGTASELDFDDSVAPIVAPSSCTNEHYYAVVGDGLPVDDPNRICAPDNTGEMSLPNTSVPYGITAIAAANTEVLIGDADNFYNNFLGFASPTTLSFKGLIPSVVRVERYDFENAAWETEDTITNTEMSNEILFEPADYDQAGNFRRFWVKNSDDRGRFQLNWIRGDYSLREPSHPSVVFENDYVSTVSIDQETDLTSQTLPSYEMTVECLDVDEEYTPDSEYWSYQFAEGTPCFLKVGYEVGEGIEYLPFMYGKLTQAPTYTEGKITFKVSFDWRTEWNLSFTSVPNADLMSRQIVDSALFKDIIEYNELFDKYDVFHGEDDEEGSECNYYGEVDTQDARQLIANALGCYITAGIGNCDLHNSNDIQYKPVVDSLTRYEQVSNTLDSKSKVGKIIVTRSENTLSSEHETISPNTPYPVIPSGETDEVNYTVPFYSFGKVVLAVAPEFWQLEDGITETMNSDGTVNVALTVTNLRTGEPRTFDYAADFYKVDNQQFKETDTPEEVVGENYENTNELVTNSYTAGKVKRIAHLVNDINAQYEVDVVQNYLYELGDVIRLETQTGIFKTCVITGLQFALPGSSGHVTCRKIFSLDDTPQAVKGAQGLVIEYGEAPHRQKITVLEAVDDTCVLFFLKVPTGGTPSTLLMIMGATRVLLEEEGETPTENVLSLILTDENNHVWQFPTFIADINSYPVTNAPIVELPDYDGTLGSFAGAYCAIKGLMTVYEEQGMTAPVNWDSEVHWNWEE